MPLVEDLVYQAPRRALAIVALQLQNCWEADKNAEVVHELVGFFRIYDTLELHFLAQVFSMSVSAKVIFTTVLLLAVQYLSMVGGLSFIAHNYDVEDVQDMSLEHVVPLDPFLGTAGGSADDLGLNPELQAIVFLTLFLLPALLVTIRQNWDIPATISYRQNRLWLFKRALLI